MNIISVFRIKSARSFIDRISVFYAQTISIFLFCLELHHLYLPQLKLNEIHDKTHTQNEIKLCIFPIQSMDGLRFIELRGFSL